MKTKKCFTLNHYTFALLLSLGCFTANNAWAEDEFDASLWGDGSVLGVDFARFNQKNAVMPGEYDADVWVNGIFKGSTKLRFVDNEETHVAELCLTPQLQEVLDLESEAIEQEGEEENCIFIKQSVPRGEFSYNPGELKLEVKIPQALTIRRPRDYVSPARWQSGTNAGFINYDANYYRYNNDTSLSENLYVGVRTGVNLGGFAFRHSGSFNWYKNHQNGVNFNQSESHYQRGETYVQKDFAWLRGNVTLGDFYTSGQIGESFSLRGVRIASDDRMLAPSQRGFAPVVRGVANTNANVTIKQNGNVIYQIAVPAGPFVISDLYPSGYNGDLLVEIQESDGRVRSFTVPFSNVAPLIRVGHFRYQLAGGRYRYWDNELDDSVVQGTLQYGLLNNLTVNGGVIVSPNYRAGLVGFGLNTPIGAFSADSTWSQAKFPRYNKTAKGYSLHGSYSINFNSTGTNIMLAAYRYSSRDFYSLRDTLSINHQTPIFGAFYLPIYYRPKNQYQFSINQNLGDWGDIYLSGQTYTYWGQSGSRSEYQVSYANNYKQLSYQIGFSQSRDNETGTRDNGVYLSFSLPLGDSNHSIDSTYSRSYGNTSIQTGLNGSFGDQYQWNYGLSASRDSEHYRNLSANGGYQSSVGTYRASYSQDNQHNRQMSFGASGSIVAHKYGVTLGQQVSDSFAIIHAKDGQGAVIESGSNRKIDYFGNGIVPYTTPYAVNYVSIDPKEVDANVEFSATEQQIVPRANSINLIDFSTHKNVMILFNLTLPNGDVVPMAATAQDTSGQFIGYVVQGGVLYAGRLTEPKGTLEVQWGPNLSEQCRFNYQVDLSEETATQAKTYDAICTPLSE